MAVRTGIVKQVLSGDTLILMGAARGGPAPQRQVNLASVMAPKVAMKSQSFEIPDEEFGWEAREFLRNMLLGGVVEFLVEYTDREKEQVSIRFQDEDVAVKLVSAGLAKVRNTRPPLCAKNISDLQSAEAKAKELKLGIWTTDDVTRQSSVRNLQWIANDVMAAKAFSTLHLGQTLSAVIEFIRDAGCYRVYFPTEQTNASLMLSGIQADMFRRTEESTTPIADPFAEEAKYFSEVRLLNRTVDVHIEGADGFGYLIGTVTHPKFNIAELLLKNGFAKINDRTIQYVPDSATLRVAQKGAQDNRIRKWHNFLPSTENCVRDYAARVIEIVSGDCLIVKILEGPNISEERRLYLASIRAPRSGNRARPDEPWAYEAKEFVRKKLIGKKVKVVLEYTREATVSAAGALPPPASDNTGRMHFVSIIFDSNKLNLNELLIGNGLARVLVHRSDEPSASNYAKLIEGEAEALAEKKGLHGAAAPLPRINDLLGQENAKKAKSFQDSLKRLESLEGIVEYVFNGGRFKIRIPSENVAIAFALSHIKCPALAGGPVNGRPRQQEEYAEEALQFSREHYMQRNVKIRVTACDIRGTFLGCMWIGKECAATSLVAHGLARVYERGATVHPSQSELKAAETEACSKRLGLWSTVTETNESQPVIEMEKVQTTIPMVQVVYSFSIDQFFIMDLKRNNLAELRDVLNAYVMTGGSASTQIFSAANPPRVGELVLALFDEDNQWYRATIEVVDRPGRTAKVSYVDYGNAATVPLDKLRKSPPQFALNQLPSFAIRCSLAGVKPPPDFEPESAEEFDAICDGQTFRCTVESYDTNKRSNCVLLHHTLPNGTVGTTSVNEALLLKGLAIVNKKTKLAKTPSLIAAQDTARQNHIGVWCHGDIDDDSESENNQIPFNLK